MSVLEELQKQKLKKEETAFVYGEVAYLDGEDGAKVIALINNKGEEAGLEYISQWDQGDYTTVYDDFTTPIGAGDEVYQTDTHIMAYNSDNEYASLYTKIPREEFVSRYGEDEIQ